MIQGLLLPIFTDFVPNAEIKYYIGFIFISIFTTNLIVNAVFVIYRFVKINFIRIKRVIRKIKRRVLVKPIDSAISEKLDKLQAA
jgi:hypothetical protein